MDFDQLCDGCDDVTFGDSAMQEALANMRREGVVSRDPCLGSGLFLNLYQCGCIVLVLLCLLLCLVSVSIM